MTAEIVKELPAIVHVAERLSRVESQIEDLRHVMLCLCLQVQPPEGLGFDIKAKLFAESPVYALGTFLDTQTYEIGRLANMLMKQHFGDEATYRDVLVGELKQALEIVRNRAQNDRDRETFAEGVPESDGR